MITIPLSEVNLVVGRKPNQELSAIDYIFHVTQHSCEVTKETLFITLKSKRVNGLYFIKKAEKKELSLQ